MPCYHSARNSNRLEAAGPLYIIHEAGQIWYPGLTEQVIAMAIAAQVLPTEWVQWADDTKTEYLEALPDWAQDWLRAVGVDIPRDVPPPPNGYAPPGGYPDDYVPGPDPRDMIPGNGMGIPNGIPPNGTTPNGAIVVAPEEEKGLKPWQWAAIGVGGATVLGLGAWVVMRK